MKRSAIRNPAPQPRRVVRAATAVHRAALGLKTEAAMLRTLEAIVEKDGSLRLLEQIELRPGERALVTLLGDDASSRETSLLSQDALATDWAREDEDQAWAHLQP